MIDLYSGTPGSGKSFHATQKIFYRLRYVGGRVIANFPINTDYVSFSFFGYLKKRFFKNSNPKKHKIGNFTYSNNNDLTVQFLKDYAKHNHLKGKEHQTLVVIDECGIMFNSRNFGRQDRMDWIEFFSLHRHYGYDFILISQSDRMIDRQIRAFVEYEHKHRNVGHFKVFGKILALLCGGSLFIDVTMFYGMREKVSSEYFRYSKKIASLYDSYLLYDEEELLEDSAADPNERETETEVEEGSLESGSAP